ncbi:hypothetical protein [Roseibium sp. SCP14]|uniref:hypothetical protein n=1 Tax=Roseibium sp. SCP14 TaxID=3141375 RepID=UPI00333CA5F5
MSNGVFLPAQFTHIRIIVGMVIGLGVARLLNGLARFVQHPGRERIYYVHIGWSLFMLLSVVHFWWFEFSLGKIEVWTFQNYLFVIAFAALYFFIAAVLYPDQMDEYSSYQAYFQDRKSWIYGLLAMMFVFDLVDSQLKGHEHMVELGMLYLVRQVTLIVLTLAAARVEKPVYHSVLVTFALATQIWLIASNFGVLA